MSCADKRSLGEAAKPHEIAARYAAWRRRRYAAMNGTARLYADLRRECWAVRAARGGLRPQ